MSRIVLHKGNRFTVVVGADHVLKAFAQVYDNTLIDQTPEGEGLVFDWSVALGLEVNRINIDMNKPQPVLKLIESYIRSEEPKEHVNMNLPSFN